MKKTYVGDAQREISFPLGGIGSGCIGLAGNGALIDFEIFGKPNKRTRNGFSHFAVKAENAAGVIDARVLQGDFQGGYTGDYVHGGPLHSGYGFGPEPAGLAGFPHFSQCTFQGRLPLAQLRYEDPHFPGQIEMTAFNPMIPHNDQDSSLPAAFFSVTLRNPQREPLRYTLALSMRNPVGPAHNAHLLEEGEGFCGLHLTQAQPEEQPERSRGGFCIATDAAEVSYQQYWYRGSWCDEREMYLRDLQSPGALPNRIYEEPAQEPCFDTATLAAHVTIPGGEARTLHFVAAWHYPYMSNDWNPEKNQQGEPVYRYWKHYYATLFEGAVAVARYALKHFGRLLADSQAFADALYASSLPEAAMEAVGANLAVLKSPVCFRLENGEFYAFEGALAHEGSCEGSCTHVWNYAYALPFLFPQLERSMRDVEYAYCMGDAGDVSFRVMLPLGRERLNFRPCADGQFGGILKCYRDWKISGDLGWIRGKWPSLKKALAYAWSPENPDRWDPAREGLLLGRQHHTLDMELFGANAWLSGFYLLALKAGAEIARALGDQEAEAELSALYAKGRQRLNTELFNGKSYIQRVDLNDQALLSGFEGAQKEYWNAEAQEIKYQVAEGCGIDQMVAQWHAHLCGLGDIFDPEKARTALRTLYERNFRSMREVENTWRLFSLQEESGLLMCTWENGKKPAVPLTYASECMTGFEYAAACHMLLSGMETEALAIVNAVRARYDGKKRNPWSEIECGSNYARSMASYSLLLAYSGFAYDMSQGTMGFFPIHGSGSFFWSLGEAWGTVSIQKDQVELSLAYGQLFLSTLSCSSFVGRRVLTDGCPAERDDAGAVRLNRRLEAGSRLVFACV